MKVLFEAIYNYWTTEGKLGLSELYLVEAKGEAVFPYGTFSTNIVADWTFTETGEDCRTLSKYVRYLKRSKILSTFTIWLLPVMGQSVWFGDQPYLLK